MKIITLLVSGALLIAGGASVHSHGGAKGIVKERMDAMGMLADAMKSLAPIVRGDVDYDADTVRKGAEALRAHSGDALTRLFPEGSISGPSEAREEIWSEWERFTELSQQLEQFATALAGAADNGLAVGHGGSGMMGQSGMMGKRGATGNPVALADMPVQGLFKMAAQTCSECHREFRIKKN
ncbi:c-type cytochrome [Roseibium sp.]|uniref:c-type cytochrome n=1 Tax=Roseibium sp. TaxID=1936156 RepID=UPI003A96EC35